MPMCRLRGRVINKLTRQPIPQVEVGFQVNDGNGWSGIYTNITVDADGEFDHLFHVNQPAEVQCELLVDKDKGYRRKAQVFTLQTTEPATDLGEIELEPYMVISPDA